MKFEKIGVLGAGTMGLGIIQVFADAGYSVVSVVHSESTLAKAPARLEKTWGRAVEKGRITAEEKTARMARVAFCRDYAELADCDLVVEAVSEEIALKQGVMKELDGVCKAETIFASNTSALSLTEIASVTTRRDRVLGMHFFNPVSAMKLVELISTEDTARPVIDAVLDLLKGIGKEPICVQESPGFIVNRILTPYMCEAFAVYEQGLASAEDIDKAMMLGAGMPMGPLKLADVVGLDICLMVSQYLTREFNDPKYKAAPCLERLVAEGNLGVKTGKGFYDYSK